jgi:hypothetical protein
MVKKTGTLPIQHSITPNLFEPLPIDKVFLFILGPTSFNFNYNPVLPEPWQYWR